MTGTPPATEAPNAIWQFLCRARPINSGPQCAINCLLAVTTDLPASSALRIQSPASFRPPTNYTTTSTSDDKTRLKSSVHCTSGGSQSTFFRATVRLQT